jgi:zinc transporter ZupT
MINFVVGCLLRCSKSRSSAAKKQDDTNVTIPSPEENSSDGSDKPKNVLRSVSIGTGAGIQVGSNIDDPTCEDCINCTEHPDFNKLKAMADNIANVVPEGESGDDDDLENKKVIDPLKEDARQLMHMGAATALAIAIHNFPEGLVTFVGYTQDPTVGVVLAIGIGIHNIPEGLCVAMPIYYATGNRWKAFLWGILSGVSEPIGALIGYLVLRGNMSGNTYGIMFGLVAGIMTLIAADELLPTAHRYDPKNEIVTYSFIFGMLAIAGSLVIFSS